MAIFIDINISQRRPRMKKMLFVAIASFCIGCVSHASDIPPPKAPQRTEAPKKARVTWVEVRTGNEFWSSIKHSERTVALIGGDYCGLCDIAKNWWESRYALPGWQYVYWRVGNSDDLLTRSFKEVFRDLQQKDNLRLPYMSIIEESADPKKMVSITQTFSYLEGCTREANKFLTMHPQGTVHF